MSEAEKQEGQKTVVAFITGLLIGGLLVWVFSSTPENTPTETKKTDTAEESAEKSSETKKETTITVEDTSVEGTKVAPVVGNGSLKVTDQAAGGSVVLGETSYPEKAGWIVVRDYTNGAAGNILGAARYNLDEGLLPTSVSLLRNTGTGMSYQVSFFADNGDKVFSKTDDAPVTGGEIVFKAN